MTRDIASMDAHGHVVYGLDDSILQSVNHRERDEERDLKTGSGFVTDLAKTLVEVVVRVVWRWRGGAHSWVVREARMGKRNGETDFLLRQKGTETS